MRLVKKFFKWMFGGIAALLLAIISIQTYYRLTPVALSDDAKALLEETKHMSEMTENGYRMLGFLAGEGTIPAAVGRCYFNAWRRLTTEANAISTIKVAGTDAANEYRKRITQAETECYGDVPKLPKLRQSSPEFRIQPGFDWQTQIDRASRPLAKIYFERWNEILDGGARGSFSGPEAPIPEYQHVVAIERARLARFAAHWSQANGDAAKRAAFASVEPFVPKVTQFADGTLIESMISLAMVSQHLLVIQSAVAREKSLGDEIAAAMKTTITKTSALPRAVSNAVGAEMRFAVWMNESIKTRKSTMGMFGDALDYLGYFAYDENDTLNLMAMSYRDAQEIILSNGRRRFEESRIRLVQQNVGCPSLGAAVYLCLPFERNATGRVLASIATPSFLDYGLRAHDVLNLTAATLLTIEARRQALSGEALAQFVAWAPADMRDRVTGEAFAYDPTKRMLTVVLQTKSSVLGEKSYQLPL